MNVAGIVEESYVDGDGIRMTVFTQGCPHHCPGCHNHGTWDMSKKCEEYTPQEIFAKYKENPLLNGITFSGGEPFLQCEELSELADLVHEDGGDVWCFSGYTLPQLMKRKDIHGSKTAPLLGKIDYLVDGEYHEQERDLSLRFRGSRNQHIWHRMGDAIWDDVTSQYN